MEYRLNKQSLLDELKQWNHFLRRKVHLIACGGTALTLLDIKASTKDVDFMVPLDADYRYLVSTLKSLGYESSTASGWKRKDSPFVFDLFRGKRIHTTELLESPLEEERHILIKEFSHLYVGILNSYDLITSKLFRGARVDFEDCLMLVKAQREEIDLDHLKEHYSLLASYDVSEKKILKHLDYFMEILKTEGLDD